ncbi:riboflavin transporter FmnP [Sporosarcina sp. P37]|uniref:ECF transporter S component n=1 Tax=unclassified Sporosarcina TaxID=2647733 RepID=UPI000A179E54|nr:MULTISPECIES: ECF transporter S component [unclassified Sporosarcina]ARK25903.1 riboflavin transporter FmnP [Sporosarcina sp. P37]PID18277.1 ECF transporter S component [Sporosarcina sp. P35]
MNNKKLRKLILVAILGSISTVLMQFNFPIPAMPGFLKIDFSEIPAVMAIMTMGPAAGIGVELLKNVMHWFLQGSPTGVPVGEIANFATGVLFIMPIYWIFMKYRSAKGLAAGLIAGTVAMAVGMSALNYLVFLPMYTYFLGMPAVTGDSLYQMIILGILPFNLVKGAMLLAITLMLYRSMEKWILQQQKKLSF